MTTSPSGILSASAVMSSTFSCSLSARVIYSEKPSRSTASAPPAATRFASADSMMSEPIFRISALRSPTALLSSSLRREFEQTSSAKPAALCAGVYFSGFISMSLTFIPRFASCHAHSLPASPAPKTVTVSINIIPYPLLLRRFSSPLSFWPLSFWLRTFSPRPSLRQASFPLPPLRRQALPRSSRRPFSYSRARPQARSSGRPRLCRRA